MCNNTQLLHEKEEARINLAMRAARPTSIIFFFHAVDALWNVNAVLLPR